MRRHLLASMLTFVLLSITSVAAAPPADRPAPLCELYAVAHFGNWYEVAGEREMRRMLSDAKDWGYNAYSDWFDTLDCVNPFSGNPQYSLGNSLWDRKRVNYKTAESLGLKTDLVFTPNHVYRDQLKPEWLAKPGPRIQGQLICPHRSGAREAILENHRRWFAHLAAAGVHLNAITGCPYDYGGCGCEKCAPWILTFADLSVEIHRIAQEYHPGIELRFIGWWWTLQEHELFAKWMDEHAPGVAAGMALYIPYGKTGVADVRLPRGCKKYAFVHIGYGEDTTPRDTYALTGPVIAPQRLEKTVDTLVAQDVTGVVAYSEGCYDDVNKALLGGLFAKHMGSSQYIIEEYARRYFGADSGTAIAWEQWLRPWGFAAKVDAAASRKAFDKLCGEPRDWRRRQWELKADMFVANQRIMAAGDAWNAPRLAAADDYWTAYEKLQREVYGIGPLRHVIAPAFLNLPWYRSWSQNRKILATQASPMKDAQ